MFTCAEWRGNEGEPILGKSLVGVTEGIESPWVARGTYPTTSMDPLVVTFLEIADSCCPFWSTRWAEI